MSDSLYMMIDRVDRDDMVGYMEQPIDDDYSIYVDRGGGSPFYQLTTSLLFHERRIFDLAHVERDDLGNRKTMTVLQKEKLVASTYASAEKTIRFFERELSTLKELRFVEEDNDGDLSFKLSIGVDSIMRVVRHEAMVSIEMIEHDGSCHIWHYDGSSMVNALRLFFADDSTSIYRACLPQHLIDWAVRQ